MKRILTTTAALVFVGAVCFAQNLDRVSQIDFKNPPLRAKPRALWPWVNGNFSLPRITAELEEAKAKGMGGFDIWDVGTMMNPGGIVPDGPAFLSDESLDGIAHAIREAGRLGLELGLITSSSWNAGGEWVKPEHGAMGLFLTDSVVTGPMTFNAALPFPIIPTKYGNRQMLVERDDNGIPVPHRKVAMLMHPVRKDSVFQSAEIVTIDPAQKTISVPAGKWRIVAYFGAPTGQPLMVPSPKSNGRMLDHFSAEAQEANMDYVISRLKTRFSSLSNLSLRYLYEDSYEVNTAVWTPTLPEYFLRMKGYGVEKYLPVLDGFVIGNRDETNRFLFDYRKVLSEMIIENHYKKGRELCEKDGLGFYAEAGGPGKPIHNVPFEDLKALGALTVPRGEFWRGHPQLDLLQIVKGISSAAHIYNQRFVEAESFTSVWLWQEGPNELKPLADRAMCEGLNRFIYHTFPHTTSEAGSPGWIYNFGTLINTTNGWWPKSQAFHDYLARCSYLLQQGNFVGDVAFYYGDEAPNFVKPKHTPAALGKGYDYDVINSDILLNHLKVVEGKLTLPHGQYYHVLVLPEDERMNPSVLKKIEQLINDGATVVGNKPTRSYSLTNKDQNDKEVQNIAKRVWGNQHGTEKQIGKGKIVWGKSIRQVLLDKNVQPDVQFVGTGDSCDFIHRSTHDAEIYFIRNASKKPFEGSVVLRTAEGTPEWWNPADASVSTLPMKERGNSTTELSIHLNGHESGFIVVGRDHDEPQSSSIASLVSFTEKNTQVTTTPISGEWELRLQHQWNTPIVQKMARLTSLHSSTNEDVRHFSGSATYTNSFEVTADQLANNDLAILRLNMVKDIADVFVNGNVIGTHWFDQQEFSIKKFLKNGRNTITVDVVNSINNALVGDAKKPQEYRQFRSNITKLPNAWMTPFAEAPLLPSGLLGPVEISWVKKIGH